MQFQRLNMDNSWWLNFGEQQFVVNPWLVGSEIDGFSWFNKQWHASAPISLSNIPAFHRVSSSYNHIVT